MKIYRTVFLLVKVTQCINTIQCWLRIGWCSVSNVFATFKKIYFQNLTVSQSTIDPNHVFLLFLGNQYDYVTWKAHESNEVKNLDNNCMLGAERTFIRRKKGTVCLNGNTLVASEHFKVCTCQTEDFLW